MKKRVLSLALALLLAVSLCAPALAAERYADEDVIYQQLSPMAQQTYDYLLQFKANFRSGTPITVRFGGTYNQSTYQSEVQASVDAMLDAYDAILLTHPEIWWLSGIGIRSDDTTLSNGQYSLPLTLSFNFQNQWASGARSVYTDEATVTSVIQEVAGEACIQGGPWDQLLYVHDWLTTHNVYNEAAAAAGAGNYSDYLPWTPVSALTGESQPVCEGYSRAFKLFCDELGYPCLYVVGTAVNSSGQYGRHSWNMVQVAGKWYAVDVTWDDPAVSGVTDVVSGHEMHTYFMVGEETLLDGYHVFSDSHFPDGAVADGASFTYPALNPEEFDPAFTWGPPDIDDPYYEDPYYEDPSDDPYYDDPYDEPEPEYIRFADVDEDAYYYPAVMWAVGVGVTNGTKLNDENGLNWFSPDDTVKRGQAVTFLWRAMGEPEPETAENPFADVKETDYFYKAVLWAVENGITNGTKLNDENGQSWFTPTGTVTRGQMVTFLWRTLGKPGEREAYPGKQWYSDAEYWAHEVGCLGDREEIYTTNGFCPRSDVVYYLFNAILLMAD